MGFPNNRITNRTSGSQLITGTSQVTGEFVSIDSLDNATKFEVLTGNGTGIANVTSTRVPVAVGGDVIYSGSAVRWAKFGRTLKMRLLLNTRLVNAAAAKSGIEALMATPANLIADQQAIKDAATDACRTQGSGSSDGITPPR